METQLLEIILISTQGIKPPSSNLRRMQTYVLAWVDSANKLRTQVDRVGVENPTWNNKFIFRVSSDFLACDTSIVAIEIYAVGVIRDHLIGTVRILISNSLPAADLRSRNFTARSPSLTAVQIRCPSGRFHSILNVAAAVVNTSDFASLTGSLAIDHRDLMGQSLRCRRCHRQRTAKSEQLSGGESCDHSCADSTDYSDGADSTTSSSSTASTVHKDCNILREMAGTKAFKSDDRGVLCGLGFQRKIHLSPLDQNFQVFPSDCKKI
ncbi:uncharacterized protein LOC117928243 [Vitis riparia]|uniref:uncharacterized protein LOC117928243 n=1 Tax=Vitis riparia TaxID=96939 RepID=UPI00155A51E3|nr:uncharacterized protein LOC117928243 [Vitis riparia]